MQMLTIRKFFKYCFLKMWIQNSEQGLGQPEVTKKNDIEHQNIES